MTAASVCTMSVYLATLSRSPCVSSTFERSSENSPLLLSIDHTPALAGLLCIPQTHLVQPNKSYLRNQEAVQWIRSALPSMLSAHVPVWTSTSRVGEQLIGACLAGLLSIVGYVLTSWPAAMLVVNGLKSSHDKRRGTRGNLQKRFSDFRDVPYLE